jgi:uncharacterized protein (TIGR01777 family)
MKIVIAGGTGFLGRPLVQHFATRRFDVVVLTRSPQPARATDPHIREVAWSPTLSPDVRNAAWTKEIDGADAVINLAGAGIADRRWTAARKRELLDSRIGPTRTLVAAMRAVSKRPAAFIQGSAVGYYGTDPDRTFDESFPPGDDFMGQMAVAWEAEAHPLAAFVDTRLVIVRSGVALAREGGALQQMARPFYFFVGGRVASGRQYLSWIHRDDWIAIVDWAVEHQDLTGPINATAPDPVTNAEFAKAVGRAVRRPSWLPVPGFALRVMFGELAQAALIEGQRVIPKRALEMGFVFRYPRLAQALQAIYGR